MKSFAYCEHHKVSYIFITSETASVNLSLEYSYKKKKIIEAHFRVNDHEPWIPFSFFFCAHTHFSALTYRSREFYSKRKYSTHTKTVSNQNINFTCPVYRLSNSD